MFEYVVGLPMGGYRILEGKKGMKWAVIARMSLSGSWYLKSLHKTKEEADAQEPIFTHEQYNYELDRNEPVSEPYKHKKTVQIYGIVKRI